MKVVQFATCSGCEYEDDDTLGYGLQQELAVHAAAAPPSAVRGARRTAEFLAYSSAPQQPLRGVPILEGGLWHLSQHEKFEPVMFSLYVNGFAYTTLDHGEVSVSLSPFSLVRNCRFQSEECAMLKCFKISHMDLEPSYFAVRSLRDREAEVERSEWVLEISHTILLITDSILPPFSMTCDPILGLAHTARRLLAGYLVHKDDSRSVSIRYCELRAHTSVCAHLVMYDNELSQVPLYEIAISESSICSDVIGINCTCFVVNTHHFASQTPSERKLWLRAISNVRVKLQNCAPDPTDEELSHYRKSIRESVRAIEATLEPTLNSEALLIQFPHAEKEHSPDQGHCQGTDDEPLSEVPSEYDKHLSSGSVQTVLL